MGNLGTWGLLLADGGIRSIGLWRFLVAIAPFVLAAVTAVVIIGVIALAKRWLK